MSKIKSNFSSINDMFKTVWKNNAKPLTKDNYNTTTVQDPIKKLMQDFKKRILVDVSFDIPTVARNAYKTDKKYRDYEETKHILDTQPREGSEIYVENAISWNAETHPEGPNDSYLVKSIEWKSQDKRLIVVYRDNYKCYYPNFQEEAVRDFVRADSKGRWALKHLWPLKYYAM